MLQYAKSVSLRVFLKLLNNSPPQPLHTSLLTITVVELKSDTQLNQTAVLGSYITKILRVQRGLSPWVSSRFKSCTSISGESARLVTWWTERCGGAYGATMPIVERWRLRRLEAPVGGLGEDWDGGFREGAMCQETHEALSDWSQNRPWCGTRLPILKNRLGARDYWPPQGTRPAHAASCLFLRRQQH